MTFLSKYKFDGRRPLLLFDVCCSLLLLLFLYTAINKFSNITRFRDVLQHSPLLASYANILAWAIPVIEISIATLLFVPSARMIGLSAAIIILTVFTAYIIYMLLFSPHLPCNCGGVLEKMTWGQHVIFNICCLFIAITARVLGNKNQPAKKPP